MSQDGIVKNHGYYRNTIRTKVNSQLWKNVRFDMNSSFNYAKTLGGGSYSGLKQAICVLKLAESCLLMISLLMKS